MKYSQHYYNELVYHIQTKLQTELPEDLKHDIQSNMEKALQDMNEWEENWYKSYVELKKKNFPFKWNELRLRLTRMNTEEADEVLDLMHMLDDGVSIR